MPDQYHTIRDHRGNQVQVTLRRDKRLTRTTRWERLPDGSILVRVPYRLPRFRLGAVLDQVTSQLAKSTVLHTRRTDDDLQQRAMLINQKHFSGKVQWNAIRWVGNMQTRLGSCTRGGPTDGQIRISDKIRNWPDWVLDYVIAHELMHRLYPNHSQAFWKELSEAYPLTERARGFISGAGFAVGMSLDDDQAS